MSTMTSKILIFVDSSKPPEMFDKFRYFLGSMELIYDMMAFTSLTK